MGRGTVSSGGDRMTGPRHGSLEPHRPGNVGPGAEGHRACPREDRTRAPGPAPSQPACERHWTVYQKVQPLRGSARCAVGKLTPTPVRTTGRGWASGPRPEPH